MLLARQRFWSRLLALLSTCFCLSLWRSIGASASCAENTTPAQCFADTTSICMWGTDSCFTLTAACSGRADLDQCHRDAKCVWLHNQCEDAFVSTSDCFALNATACWGAAGCEVDSERLQCVVERSALCPTALTEPDCTRAIGCVWQLDACVAATRDYSNPGTCVGMNGNQPACNASRVECEWQSDTAVCAVRAKLETQDWGRVLDCKTSPANPFLFDDTSVTSEQCASRGACELNTARLAPFTCSPSRGHVCPYQQTRALCALYSFCDWDQSADACAASPTELYPGTRDHNVVILIVIVLASALIVLYVYSAALLSHEHRDPHRRAAEKIH